MFDTLTRLTSRIARRYRPKRPAAAVAHVASTLAVGLTLIMVGSGHVAESNPVSAWLHAQIGLPAWALLTPIGVGAALALADQLPFERAKWAIAGALGLDAIGNLATTASVGLPASILATSAVTIVGTMLVAGVVYWCSELATMVVSAPRPSLESVQAVALSILMVTSMVGGVAFVGTQPISSAENGTVQAANSTTPDLTTWRSNNDTGVGLDVTSDGYTVTDLQQTEGAQVYNNSSSENFNFKSGTINMTVNGTKLTDWGQFYTGISNSSSYTSSGHPFAGMAMGDQNGDFISAYQQSGSSDSYGNKISIQPDTKYYVEIEYDRGDGQVTVYVYNDSAKTDLRGTSSVVFDPTNDYDHLFALNTRNADSVNNEGDIHATVSDFQYSKKDSYPTLDNSIDTSSLTKVGSGDIYFSDKSDEIIVDQMDSGTASDHTVTDKSTRIPSETKTVTVNNTFSLWGADGDSGIVRQSFAGTNGSAGTWGNSISIVYTEGTDADGKAAARIEVERDDDKFSSGDITFSMGEEYFSETTVNRSSESVTLTIWESRSKNSEVGNVTIDRLPYQSLNYFYPVAGNDGSNTGHPIDAHFRNVKVSTSASNIGSETTYNTSNFTGNYSALGAKERFNNTILELDDVQGTDSAGVSTTKNAPGDSESKMQFEFMVDSVGSDASEWLTGYSTQNNTKASGNGNYTAVRIGYLFEEGGPGVSLETSLEEKGIHSVKLDEQYYATLEVRPSDSKVSLSVHNDSDRTDLYFQTEAKYDSSNSLDYVRPALPEDGDKATSTTKGRVKDLTVANRLSNTISAKVTDRDGNPVNDSTVQATVVDQDALDTSNLNQTAQELLDEAENPEPPSYDARMNLNSEFDDVDAEYVSVHPESQMSIIEASTGGLDPDVQVRSGEEIYLMSWDATDEPGFLSTDLINRQLPGSPTSSTIVIEQLDHSGDVTETRELTTEDPEATASIGYVDILDDYSRTHVSTRLPDGFYRVSTKDSDFAYVIAVGNPAQIIEKELKDEADRLTDHAQKMRDRHNNGVFQTVTGSTNETGETTLDIPASASVIQVQAYKGPDASTVGASTTADITMQDVRDSREAGYDEAIYLSTDPKRVDMSETDGSVTIEMYKLDGGPMENMTDWDQRLEDALNEALNASIDDLESVYDDRLETVEREELERRHEQLRSIAERAGLLERVKELLGRGVADTDTGSDAELRADLGAIEQALAEQQSQGSTGETETEIDSGELYTEIPFASEIDPEAISVIVHTEAGESITLPDSEYRIESNGIIDGGDMVVIDGYKLPTNTAVADVEVRGVSPAGRTLRERVSAVNPTMAGSVPGIDAVDVNTIRPGPDERVGLQLRPSDSDAYDSLSSVDVYGPDGQTVPVTLDGERAYFDTEGKGVYTVRTTYSGSDGTEFVETVRLRAGSRMISERPTVRVTEGLTGPTAIVGQGLDSATIETADGETAITVRQPGDSTRAPGEIHIEAQQLDASDTITVNVVSGELEESVNQHTNIVLHTNEIGDDALVYRNGKPVTADGDTRFGEYETRTSESGDSKTVIYTYSEADGTVQMSISADPGVVERVLFDVRVRSPVDVPFVGLLFGAVELADSVPLGPTAALQTVDTPELREADPGAIVPSTGVVNTPGVIAT